VPITHPHQRYSVTGYREEETPEGELVWSADLLRYGQSFGLVGNRGEGGPDDFTFTDENYGSEFVTAARELHPDVDRPSDVLVDELVMIRALNSLDQVAYCLAGDEFEEFGEHRLAEPGVSFTEVRRELATRFADRSPRIWDKNCSAMVPVLPEATE